MSEIASPDPSASPCVRVFLSVDLFGSTRLKNVLNQQQLWTRYRGAQAVIEALRQCGMAPEIDSTVADRAVLMSLEVGTVDFDWSTVVETFYRDFHTEFRTQMLEVVDEFKLLDGGPQPVVEPWKAVGDELIYVFEIKSRRRLHWIVIAFLAALRKIDGAISDRNRQHNLRLKGSAWVAGFPVRNRRVRLPGSKEAFDYLGPEVDTGFRIGECTRPGMLAVSVELAELLAEIPTPIRPMTGMIVGWERLKGVWDDRHYPVIWVDLPDGHLKHLKAKEIDDWERQESKFSQEWGTGGNTKPDLPELCDQLSRIRAGLPGHLGIVDPYIVDDPEVANDVPQSHRDIQALLSRVTTYQRDASSQDADSSKPSSDNLDASTEQQIESIIDGAMTPPPVGDAQTE